MSSSFLWIVFLSSIAPTVMEESAAPQGQRDYFGSHGFERTDKSGFHTSNWNQL